MKGDFTRDTFDARNHFTRVLMQQGRVQLDADGNEQAAILLHYLQSLAADLTGPHSGPAGNCGFQFIVDADAAKGVSAHEKEHLKRLLEEHGPVIGKGHYYVEGKLCENEGFVPFARQPDYPLPDEKELADLEAGTYLVYLDVWERHITYVQRDAIREVALGGPDTATRAQLVWQVKTWGPISQDDCAKVKEVWSDLVAKWQPKNRGRLKAQAKITEAIDTTDPCITSPEARYRGAENQLYRIEIHHPGTVNQATFKWSRENGTVLFPIRWLKGDQVAVEHLGRDDRLALKIDDWVEVVDDDVTLQGRPGPLLQVEAIDRMEAIITLKVPEGVELPLYEETSTKHPSLRRWDHREGDPTTGYPELADDGALRLEENEWFVLEDGVQIFFQRGLADTRHNYPGHFYRSGDYWLIPARTATGDVEWPQATDGPLPMPPHGIEHDYAPLAMITVAGGGALTKNEDCRYQFKLERTRVTGPAGGGGG